jgi:hypothetical protein
MLIAFFYLIEGSKINPRSHMLIKPIGERGRFMKQLEFNPRGITDVKKVRDIKELDVSYTHNLFSRNQYDTEFFYYTEVVADWFMQKRENR